MYTPNDTPDDKVPIVEIITPRKRQDRFIKGPLPLAWLEQAAQCSPSAVKVGLLLFYLRGLGHTELYLSNERAGWFQMSRNTKRAALNAMERAGLVTLKRSGQRVMVTIKHVTT
jgi:DNA-binding transcriptional ArsR family regulator